MTIEEIYSGMLTDFTARTGMEVPTSGDLAVRLYAVAAQIYSLQVQTDWVARQCFPQTALGEYLDRHAQLRGLSRHKKACAEGMLRFGVEGPLDTDLVIPEGSICMTAGLIRFQTTEEGTLPAGEVWVEVPARAVESGSMGNVSAGTVLSMAVAPVGAAWVTNPEAFAGGTDEETDEALRERVLETFRRLPNGANAAFYEQGARSFEQVAAAAVLPRNRGIGTVDVVIATHAGFPDEELIGQVQAWFEERREIAVDVQVLAPEEKNMDVSVRVKAKANYDGEAVRREVSDKLTNWFNGERLGQNVLLAHLNQVIYTIDGVENYVIDAPIADISVAKAELPRLGSLTVEELA